MILRIGKASKRLGIHPNTLRHLEKKGIIKVNRDWNGYRIFDEIAIKQLKETLFQKAEKSE